VQTVSNGTPKPEADCVGDPADTATMADEPPCEAARDDVYAVPA
jgi:hypothetical protein